MIRSRECPGASVTGRVRQVWGDRVLAVCLALATGCGSGSTEPTPADTPQPTATLSASSLFLDDATNQGNAGDFVLTFTTSADPTVAEYRVFIVPTESASAFGLSTATNAPAGRYAVEATGGGIHTVGAPAALTTPSGDPIADGGEYVAFVLSVGTGSSAPSLSTASNRVVLRENTIKITYLRNAGVLIEDAERSVLIDALPTNLNGWIEMPASSLPSLTSGQGRYGAVSALLVTHDHGDHFSGSATQTFLAGNQKAKVVGPPTVTAGFSPSRVVPVSPERGMSTSVGIDGIRIDVLNVRHFDQFGNDFSATVNYGYVVHLGGRTVVHLGDVQYASGNLSGFGLDMDSVDVVIVPTFNTLLSAGSATVVAETVAPATTIALHFQAAQVAQESALAADLFGAVPFTTPLQFIRR